jgi:hypothetical protein
MYTLCRFLVLENCYTAEQLATLTEDEAHQLEEKLRGHAERCRGSDGVHRLEQAEDVILIPKPQAGHAGPRSCPSRSRSRRESQSTNTKGL